MDLLQRFAHGEIDAFETLVRQFQGDIYAWTVRMVRDPGVAEDLTVETLWRVYRAASVSPRWQLQCLGTADRYQLGDRPSAAQPAGAEFRG